VICAIIESKVTPDKLTETLEALAKVAKQIDTVFSVDVVSVVEETDQLPGMRPSRL